MILRLKSRGYFALIAIVGLGLLYCVAVAVAQEGGAKESAKPAKQTVKETAKKGTSGTDQNIKSDSEKNDPAQKVEPPPQKSGKKSRGLGPYPCSMHVDNHTPWLIRIYVDGSYRGTINSYGDLVGIIGNGSTAAYGVAVFTDGSTRTWGPHVFECGAGSSYTWQLYQ
jgi:hypothetical protein